MTADPRLIKHLNEYIRPMSERLRNMQLRALAFSSVWSDMRDICESQDPNEIIDDNRSDEGINQLTYGEIIEIGDTIISLLSAFNGLAGKEKIAKACVRPVDLE